MKEARAPLAEQVLEEVGMRRAAVKASAASLAPK